MNATVSKPLMHEVRLCYSEQNANSPRLSYRLRLGQTFRQMVLTHGGLYDLQALVRICQTWPCIRECPKTFNLNESRYNSNC